MTDETTLARALRRIAKRKRLSSLDVPVLNDAADEIDKLTEQVALEQREHRRSLEAALATRPPEPGGETREDVDIPRYGNGLCACGHTSARHACDHESGDSSCTKCECPYFVHPPPRSRDE